MTYFEYMAETWKDILGFNGDYQISNLGRIISKKYMPHRIMKQQKVKGYFNVWLSLNNSGRSYRVSRLVALAFIPNQGNKTEVNHIDGNKFNNSVDNLEWCTRRENMQHARDILGVANLKLTEDHVLSIRKLKKENPHITHEQLAELFGVGRTNITMILTRRSWKYL